MMALPRVCKWLAEVVIAVLAIVMAFPLLLVIGLGIKLTSRGPMLYRANRLGVGGKPIRVLKFRTMYADADQRLEQLLTAPSVEACAQLLSEWGYAPVHDEPSLQAALSAQREAVFADVSRFMPEAEVLDVFRLKYDYHNIKTLLKAPQDA